MTTFRVIEGGAKTPFYIGIKRHEGDEYVDTRGVHFTLIRNDRDPLAARADAVLLGFAAEAGEFSS